MNEVVILGSGSEAEYAYWWLTGASNQYMVKCFVDENCVGTEKKWCGNLPIMSPDILKEPEYQNVAIIQATDNIQRIKDEKIMSRVVVFNSNVFLKEIENCIHELENENRVLDYGHFLTTCNNLKICYVGTPYGSGIFDYMLIRAIAAKFKCQNYLEIGTYIGESIKTVTDVCKYCHSLTLHPSLFSSNKVNYADRLANDDNVIHHYGDSKEFDYNSINDKIDLYFIDGDHSYTGVYWDTMKVFEHRTEDSFVIWHDFNIFNIAASGVAAPAIKRILGKKWKNVFIFDKSMCGIYVPEKYQHMFLKYNNDDASMYYYQFSIEALVDRK